MGDATGQQRCLSCKIERKCLPDGLCLWVALRSWNRLEFWKFKYLCQGKDLRISLSVWSKPIHHGPTLGSNLASLFLSPWLELLNYTSLHTSKIYRWAEGYLRWFKWNCFRNYAHQSQHAPWTNSGCLHRIRCLRLGHCRWEAISLESTRLGAHSWGQPVSHCHYLLIQWGEQ